MVIPARPDHGFTVVELLVTLFVIAVLVSLMFPVRSHGIVHASLAPSMNNARSIYMATMSMAIDGKGNCDPSLGWPGDLKARGQISTLSDFVNVLVRNDYLKPGDLKIFSAPDIKPYKGTLSSGSNGVLIPAFKDENSAFKVYLVKDSDSANTVFLATKNYTYGKPLGDPKAKPHGAQGFVVLHKGGDASILKKQQTGALNLIGILPGGTSEESSTNCLNPEAKAP